MSQLHPRIAALMILAATGIAIAEDEKKDEGHLLGIDTYMEMESVRSPNISPDGKLIVFSRGWVDKVADKRRSNLWMTDIEGDRIRELTHGSWSDSAPVWSPDGQRIAFISDRDGTSQLHVMWLDTREAAQLTHLERAPESVRWSPNGKEIAFTSFVPDTEKPLKIKMPKKPKGAKWAKPAVVVDRLSWQRDGRGFRPKGYSHVYVIDSILGGTPRKITDGDYTHGDPRWSVDGKTIFLSGIRKPEAEYLRGDSEIYAVDLKTLDIKTLTDRDGPDRGQRISPDGRWIVYTGFDQKRFTSHLSSIYLMDIKGGTKKVLADKLPNSPRSVTWAPDSSGVYYMMSERGTSNLYFVYTDGGVRKITNGNHVLNGFTLSATGQAATVRSTPTMPGVLTAFHVKDAGTLNPLVNVNTDVLGAKSLSNVEELQYKSSDGLDIQGWLIKPADFDPSKKYPMLLWIHGGPWSMYSVSFNWAFQNFAASGYAVLYVNPRGSTGYGQDFVNGIQYAYPGKDLDDLMAGVDAAIAKGWIDERNLFVCGGSGGGVLTAWIVGHTDRFRAAVSMRPVINWHSFVGTTDGASWYDQFRKFPWEDPEEYSLRSPLRYVGNVTTPTMVMTGESDLRTPMTQSEEYYRALKVLKKETLLVRMPNEYHGWRRPSHRIAQQLYLKAWFEKYMVE